jgi:ribosome maturation factor RimP
MEYLVAKTIIEKKVCEIVGPMIADLGFDLIRVKYIDGKRNTLQIMLDKGDDGIEISECAKISTTISALLDVNDPIKNEYDLEVSSPGINRPLTRKKDFQTWSGFYVKVKTNETIEKRKNFKGILRGVEENEILIEVDEGTIGLDFDWIDEANLSISMERLLKDAKYEKIRTVSENEFDKIEID